MHVCTYERRWIIVVLNSVIIVHCMIAALLNKQLPREVQQYYSTNKR